MTLLVRLLESGSLVGLIVGALISIGIIVVGLTMIFIASHTRLRIEFWTSNYGWLSFGELIKKTTALPNPSDLSPQSKPTTENGK